MGPVRTLHRRPHTGLHSASAKEEPWQVSENSNNSRRNGMDTFSTTLALVPSTVWCMAASIDMCGEWRFLGSFSPVSTAMEDLSLIFCHGNCFHHWDD